MGFNKYMVQRFFFKLLFVFSFMFSAVPAWSADCPEFLNHNLKKLHSKKTLNICKAYAGKPLLIVNTASRCSFSQQFNALENIHKDYKNKGLVVLGFPSNDFGLEEENEKNIANICYQKFGVTFDMFAPIKVTGPSAHPIFTELAQQATEPSWNFNKYLVTPDGKVEMYFDSTVEPDSYAMRQAIEALLQSVEK